MKRRWKILLCALLSFAAAFLACACDDEIVEPPPYEPPSSSSSSSSSASGTEPEEPIRYTVTFQVDGETYHVATVEENGKLTAPTAPKKQQTSTEVYEFVGWFIGDRAWNFETDTVTGNVVLTAKWEVTEEYTKEYLPSD